MIRIDMMVRLRDKQIQEELKTPNQVREELGLPTIPMRNVFFDVVCYECRLMYTPIKDGYNNSKDIKITVVGDNVVKISCSKCNSEVHIHDGDDI